MGRESNHWGALERLASGRDGYFSSAEAHEVGVSDRVIHHHVEAARLERLGRGVLRVTSFPRADHESQLAAELWARDAVLTHETAMALLTGTPLPDAVDISVSSSWERPRAKPPAKVTVHRQVLSSDEVTRLGPHTVSTARKTLYDCAAKGLEPTELELAKRRLVDRGLIQHRDAVEALSHALGTSRAAAGRTFRYPFKSEVNSATTEADLRRIHAHVLAMDLAVHFPDHLGGIHNKRSKLLEVADPKRSRLERWIALMLWWSASGPDHLKSPSEHEEEPFSGDPDLPPDFFPYALNAARQASHPLEKVALFLGLWRLRELWSEVSGSEKFPHAHVLGAEVGDAALQAAQHLLSDDEHSFYASSWWRLAASIALSFKTSAVVRPAMVMLEDHLRTLSGVHPPAAVDLIEIELDLRSPRKSIKGWTLQLAATRRAQLERLATTIEEEIRGKYELVHISHRLIDLLKRLAVLDGSPLADAEVARMGAVVHESIAATTDNAHLAQMQWQAAVNLRERAGDRQEATHAANQSRIVGREIIDEGAFHTHTATVEVTEHERRVFLARFFYEADSVEEVLARMTEHAFVPWFDSPEDQKITRGIATSLFPSVRVVGDRIQQHRLPSENEDTLDWEAREKVGWEMNFCSPFIVMALRELQRHVAPEDIAGALLSLFLQSESVGQDDLSFLAASVEAFVFDDWLAVMHILPPRIEAILRETTRRRGGSITNQKLGALQEVTLGGLIRGLARDGLMQPDLCRFLESALVDEEFGLNLRNRPLHGLVTPAECNETNAARLLHTALVVWRWSLDTGATFSILDEAFLNAYELGQKQSVPPGPLKKRESEK